MLMNLGTPISRSATPTQPYCAIGGSEGTGGGLGCSYDYADYAQTLLREPVLGEPRINWYVGVGEDGELVEFDWSAAPPHLLVAGNKGSGKSGVMNTMLTQMLHNNEPEDTEFWLVDPGNELQIYQDLAHVKYFLDMSVTEDAPLHVSKCLFDAAETEMLRRYKLMAAHPQKPRNVAKARAIASEDPYNYSHLSFPYVFLVFTEYVPYLAKPSHRNNNLLWYSICNSLTQIAMKGIAAGINIITCTQYPVKDNIPATLQQQSRMIGFRTSDLAAPGASTYLPDLEKSKPPFRGELSTSKGTADFRGLRLRTSHEDRTGVPDERIEIIESIPYTQRWPKLPDGVTPGPMVTLCENEGVYR